MAYLGFVPPGVVLPFAGATPPQGWLLCDGTAYSRTTYAALFAVIGTTYDTQFNEVAGGNHSAPAGTDFRVPDYRASFLRGVGQASGKDNTTLGGRQGEKTKTPASAFTTAAQTVTGTVSQSSHSHRAYVEGGSNRDTVTGGGIAAGAFANQTHFTDSQTPSISHSLTAPASTVNGGGDNETRPMNKGVNYIIKI